MKIYKKIVQKLATLGCLFERLLRKYKRKISQNHVKNTKTKQIKIFIHFFFLSF